MYKNILLPIWSPLSHEHIVPLLAVHTHGDSLPKFEVPYYKQGNIMDHNRRHPDANKLKQITQIAAGISHLHCRDVDHGNICPTNILIKDDGGICISDPAFNILMRQLTYDTHAPTPATWCYKPPEELLNATPVPGSTADVYCWASVVYEVFSGKRPYHDHHRISGIVEIVHHGHRALARPLEINHRLWSIMQGCWGLNPEDRPAMHQVESELRGFYVV